MKAKTYNWIVRVNKNDGSVEYSLVMDYTITLMRIYLRNLRNKQGVYFAHAFKQIDTL